jgi:glyoxylate reductase
MDGSLLPQIVADCPVDDVVSDLLTGKVQLVPWQVTESGSDEVVGIYTYGHPLVDRALLDRFPHVRIISNYGVGVDHIDVAAAAERSIPIGNTPGVLNGATADMAWALLLAAGRRLTEGERYARSPAFTHYDPGYILGREVHGATLGIVGLGAIGAEIAARAHGFGMTVLYHNRRRREDEQQIRATWVEFDTLLESSDYVVLSTPLTPETHHRIGSEQLRRMKPTAILVNVSRGPVVDTAALTEALLRGEIYAAGLDVTDPEPLPRDHPLLTMDNAIIAPHLGSATVQTRRHMAEVSVENLLLGLDGQPLRHQVTK